MLKDDQVTQNLIIVQLAIRAYHSNSEGSNYFNHVEFLL